MWAVGLEIQHMPTHMQSTWFSPQHTPKRGSKARSRAAAEATKGYIDGKTINLSISPSC